MAATRIIELETVKDKNKNLQSSNKSVKGQEYHIAKFKVAAFIMHLLEHTLEDERFPKTCTI